MRIDFPRLPDGRRSHSVVTRDDGVCYRVDDGVASDHIPHDLVHLVVERSTRDAGGFWGAVAAGAVFPSMHHLDGRRPPHAQQRSATAMHDRSHTLQRTELMADLVRQVITTGATTATRVEALARERLSTLQDSSVDAHAVLRAAADVRAASASWSRLNIGEALTEHWPSALRR